MMGYIMTFGSTLIISMVAPTKVEHVAVLLHQRVLMVAARSAASVALRASMV